MLVLVLVSSDGQEQHFLMGTGYTAEECQLNGEALERMYPATYHVCEPDGGYAI